MPGRKDEKNKTGGFPMCCPYCADSKFPCVKMERAIARAVAAELEKRDMGQAERESGQPSTKPWHT